MAARPGRHRLPSMRRLWPRTPFSRAWLVRAGWVYAAIVVIRLQEDGHVLPQVGAVLAATCLWAYIRSWVDVTTVSYAVWPAIVVTGAMAAAAAELQQPPGGAVAALVLLCATGWWIAEDARRAEEVRAERRRRLMLRRLAPALTAGAPPPALILPPETLRRLDLEPRPPTRHAAPRRPSGAAAWPTLDAGSEKARDREPAGVG